ncbi:hypothetical protein V8D89_016322 [Ganoderma adspersum]
MRMGTGEGDVEDIGWEVCPASASTSDSGLCTGHMSKIAVARTNGRQYVKATRTVMLPPSPSPSTLSSSCVVSENVHSKCFYSHPDSIFSVLGVLSALIYRLVALVYQFNMFSSPNFSSSVNVGYRIL